MDGIHDMGGMEGFGPMVRDEENFHAPWERRAGRRRCMARVDVIMPQMGESIAEGTVAKWLKQVGDEVKRDEAILEISTDSMRKLPLPE